MRVAENTLSYTIPPEQRGYYELSSAIVNIAVKDYRRISRVAYKSREYERLRTFFLSEVFENISGCENPNMFLLKLDEQIEKEIESGERRKREKQAMKCNG